MFPVTPLPLCRQIVAFSRAGMASTSLGFTSSLAYKEGLQVTSKRPFGSGAQLFVSSGHYRDITSRGFQNSGSLNKLKVVASESCHFTAFTSEPPQNSIHYQCPQDKIRQPPLLWENQGTRRRCFRSAHVTS